MGHAAEIVSAGAVVQRKTSAGGEVLLVHRPKYDDWSFPKGKLDAGEHLVTAAVREVAEETGLDIRLGPPLDSQTYRLRNGQMKQVHYWVARVVGDDDVASYRANDEVDQVAWLPLDQARDRLSYPYDVDTLADAARFRRTSYPLVVLRHSRAHPRKSWPGDDRERPLTEAGQFQSARIVPLLKAYGVTRVFTSDSTRCAQTLAPYTEHSGLDAELTPDLSEQHATPTSVSRLVQRALDAGEPAVICTHRPVLPWVFEALALDERKLEPGTLLVAHHRRNKVVSVERHDVSVR